MGYNRNFVVMFNTMNYYPMFKSCQYKYSKANHKDVMVLNVDINSTEKNKKVGVETCDELGIHFVNPNQNYVGTQFGVQAVDDYLTQNNLIPRNQPPQNKPKLLLQPTNVSPDGNLLVCTVDNHLQRRCHWVKPKSN